MSEFVSVVASDDDDLSMENGHRRLPFFKQKFFAKTVPALMEHYKEGEGDHLILDAVFRQLPELPAGVVDEHMSPHVASIAQKLFGYVREIKKLKVRYYAPFVPC